MTPRQRIELRRSEIRSRLGEVAGLTGDALTDEIATERTTLFNELEASEPQLRAAIASEPDSDERRTDAAEDREVRSLIERSNLGQALADSISRGVLTGTELELSEARGCGGKIPFDLIERRAAVTVPASGSGESTDSHEILRQIFETPVSAFCGCERPRVATGVHAYPIIGPGSTVENPAQGAAVSESSPAITAKTISPTRLTAQIRFQIEDAAILPMLETSLQQNLREAIADALEKEAVEALQSAKADAPPAGATVAVTYQIWRSLVVGGIDGTLAQSVKDVKMLVGTDSIRKLETVDFTANADSYTAADFSRMKAGGIMSSVHCVAAASNDQEVVLIRGMHPGSLIQPVWEGFEVIRDRYTDAGKGEIILTGIVLQGIDVPRNAVFSRESIQLA